MSIVVFYMRNLSAEPNSTPEWLPECLHFDDRQMSEALKQCQVLRADSLNAHVTMSSEMREMVGHLGVNAVENGLTPDGHAYEWSKAGRAGASRRNAQQPPIKRQDHDK